VNLILERERSLLEREAAAETLRAANKRLRSQGMAPMPPLRGLSNEAAGKIISAINAFIISRRFQDEVAEKRRADDLENRLNEGLSSSSATGSVLKKSLPLSKERTDHGKPQIDRGEDREAEADGESRPCGKRAAAGR
jgi:hypothetical protein